MIPKHYNPPVLSRGGASFLESYAIPAWLPRPDRAFVVHATWVGYGRPGIQWHYDLCYPTAYVLLGVTPNPRPAQESPP